MSHHLCGQFSLGYREANLNRRTRLLDRILLETRVQLAGDQRCCHEDHYRQTDDFIEIALQKGLHVRNPRARPAVSELVL